MAKIKQQSELATKKNDEIDETNKMLKKQIGEGNAIMGQYATEISKNTLKQSESILKRLKSSRRSLTRAMKRSKLWKKSSIKTSLLKIP